MEGRATIEKDPVRWKKMGWSQEDKRQVGAEILNGGKLWLRSVSAGRDSGVTAQPAE